MSKPIVMKGAPFRVQPCQLTHGAKTVIVNGVGYILARIDSRAWDKDLAKRMPLERDDRVNAHAFARSPEMVKLLHDVAYSGRPLNDMIGEARTLLDKLKEDIG